MMFAPRQLLLIVLAFLAISETSTHRFNQWRRWYRSPPMWRRCHRLPYLCNGQVTRNGWSKIDYVCNPGYKLAVTADCFRGNSWTPRVTCEEILCDGEPIIAANSSLDGDITSRRPGAEYNFTCNPGLKGMGKVVCDESGKWNVDEVECTECINVEGVGVKFNTSTVQFENETQCTARCDDEDDCNVSFFANTLCELYPLPIVAVSRPETLQDCVDACSANDDCKLLVYETENSFNECALLNTDDVESLTTEQDNDFTILGKNCPF